MNPIIIFPENFSDYEWEVAEKGCLSGVVLELDAKTYRLNIYDAVRLKQEIGDELQREGFFFEPNVIVVSSVGRTEIEQAVELLLKVHGAKYLLPEL